MPTRSKPRLPVELVLLGIPVFTCGAAGAGLLSAAYSLPVQCGIGAAILVVSGGAAVAGFAAVAPLRREHDGDGRGAVGAALRRQALLRRDLDAVQSQIQAAELALAEARGRGNAQGVPRSPPCATAWPRKRMRWVRRRPRWERRPAACWRGWRRQRRRWRRCAWRRRLPPAVSRTPPARPSSFPPASGRSPGRSRAAPKPRGKRRGRANAPIAPSRNWPAPPGGSATWCG